MGSAQRPRKVATAVVAAISLLAICDQSSAQAAQAIDSEHWSTWTPRKENLNHRPAESLWQKVNLPTLSEAETSTASGLRLPLGTGFRFCANYHEKENPFQDTGKFFAAASPGVLFEYASIGLSADLDRRWGFSLGFHRAISSDREYFNRDEESPIPNPWKGAMPMSSSISIGFVAHF